MTDPAIKTTPHPHQAELYAAHRDDPYYGLLHEMGLGKSKIIIDVASYLFLRGKIQALLIVAPNSVYAEWVNELLPAHMAAPYVKLCFRTDEQGERRQLRRALFLNPTEYGDKLRVLCMSYDGVKSKNGNELASSLVLLYKTMIVADESTALKNGHTVTSKTMKKLRASCHYAWIATGTPIAQSPFDFHSQIEFLAPEFWRRHGMKSFSAFKQEFGIFELRRAGSKAFNTLVAYRNLDRLYAMIKPFCSRLTKEDSGVKLPPKTYRTISFRMHPEQRRVYDDLRKKFLAELDDGAVVEAALAVVRLTRLQQIASGFVMAETSSLDETPGLVRDCVSSLPRSKELSAALDAFGVSQEYYDSALSRGVERQISEEDYAEALESIDDLIDRSSLGDPLTKQIRSLTPPDVAQAVVARAAELGGWTDGSPLIKQTERQIVEVVPPEDNPRLRLLLDLIEQASHKVVVWCRFKKNVDDVVAALERAGIGAVRYDGSVNQRDRLVALSKFRDPDDSTRVLVANVHAISQGVTLLIAKTMIHYTRSFSPERELQADDRNHRIGQDSPVLVIDLVAEYTVEEKLIETHIKKHDLSAAVMGDRYREWLQPVRREED